MAIMEVGMAVRAGSCWPRWPVFRYRRRCGRL